MKRFGLFLISILFLAGCNAPVAEDYNPEINSEDFTSQIEGNQYFNLPVGTVLKYEEQSEDGLEKIEIEILDEVVDVSGVETRVYLDTVYVDGQIVEQTRDYLAQHKETGDVWYFGEDVNNYEDGKFVDHEGAWLYGKDGALPGIWIKNEPEVGQIYRQEYLAGEAEDMVEVISLNEIVEVGGRSFKNCLQTYDYTPLDKDSKEYKFYCPEVGNLVHIDHLVEEASSNLVSAEKNGEAVF